MFFKDEKCPNCETYYDPTLKECPNCHKSNELYALNRVPKNVVFLHPIAQIGLFLAGFGYTGMLIAQLLTGRFLLLFNLEMGPLRSIISLTIVYSLMLGGLLSIVLLTRRKLFFENYQKTINYLYGVGYAITIVFVSLIIGAVISLFPIEVEDNINQETANLLIKNYPILSFVVLGFIGPVCEELTYRVGLYSLVRRYNKYLAFVLTVIFFALIHFDFEAENMVNELIALPSYLISGFILTLAYEHRGPACSMTAHILYNIAAYTMVLIK